MSTIPSSASSPILTQNLPQPTEQAAINSQPPLEVVIVPDSLPQTPSSSSPENNRANTEALKRYDFQLMPGQNNEELNALSAAYHDLESEESCKKSCYFWINVTTLITGVAIPILAMLTVPYVALGYGVLFLANYIVSRNISERLVTIDQEKRLNSHERITLQRAIDLPGKVAIYSGISRENLAMICPLIQMADRAQREVPNRMKLEALDLADPNACTVARAEVNHFDVFNQPKENIRAVKEHLDRHAHLWPSSNSTS